MSVSDPEILDGLTIPASELSFETARSSGPGGQHVNKTETKVTLVFDLEASSALDEEHKRLVRERLASRISKSGELRVASQRHRSQKANRDAAIERFIELIRAALTPRVERKPTRVPTRARRQRLEDKRRTSEKKQQRRDPDW